MAEILKKVTEKEHNRALIPAVTQQSFSPTKPGYNKNHISPILIGGRKALLTEQKYGYNKISYHPLATKREVITTYPSA